MKRVMGHVIRWVIIVSIGAFILASMTRFSVSPERGIRESLLAMEQPGDVTAVSTIKVGSSYSIVFWDEEHQLYHHSFMNRIIGLFWEARGGGFGYQPQDEWLIRYGEGYSTQSSRAYHYVNGWVNDPLVAMVEVQWRDGVTERMEPAIGKIIHFAREGKAGNSSFMVQELLAYDAQGNLLHRLDQNNPSVAAVVIE